MSWPSFVTPSAAWLALAAIPLLLLYFLKLRRQSIKLSSTVLWRQVMLDERVNSPFRRLVRNVLLVLQLVMMALLVLAAMQPLWRGAGEGRERVLVLVDCSASMATLDRPGGVTRLQAATDRLGGIIDGLERAQEMAVIAFCGSPQLVAPFTSNKRVLRDAAARIEVVDQGADLASALRMAGAMAKAVEIARVVLLSDGNIPAEVEFDLPFEVEYLRVPRGGQNIGITRLHASREVRGGWQVFVGVESSEGATSSAHIRLEQDGEVRYEEPVSLQGGDGHRLMFPVPGEARTLIEVALEVDGFDSLESDNRGFLQLDPIRPIRVRVDGELEGFGRALEVHAGIEMLGAESVDPPDLVVSKTEVDPDLEAVGLSVGAMPAGLGELLEKGDAGSAVTDWLRADPLLEHVELGDLIVIDSVRWRGEAGEAQIERLGWEVVVHGDRGPLLLRRGQLQGRRTGYAMLFDADRSTLPYRVGFPVLVSNLIGITMRAAGLSEVAAVRAGVLPEIVMPVPGAWRVVGPQGALTWDSAPDGLLSGVRAPRVGWYAFEQDGVEARRVGANLLDRSESLLWTHEELRFRELKVAAVTEDVDSGRPLWAWLAGLCLPLLLAEWWLFRRRPSGTPSSGRAAGLTC